MRGASNTYFHTTLNNIRPPRARKEPSQSIFPFRSTGTSFGSKAQSGIAISIPTPALEAREINGKPHVDCLKAKILGGEGGRGRAPT